MLSGAKATNPNLRFGVTIYEDELENPSQHFLDNAHVPASIKARIDDVHLYLHYRENAPKYPGYVRLATTLFPNAKVIAGSYPYDRIDYIPCGEGSQSKCTASQEVELFDQSLRAQAQLVASGAVTAIEFYPGFFGKPAAIFAKNGDNDVCDPLRLGGMRRQYHGGMQTETATILGNR